MAPTPDPYAGLSDGYGGRRRPDPRIAAVITGALAGARTVANVGAGAGSYEPADRRVVALEPSPSMLAQRPAGAAPSVRAAAEALPLPDDAVEAALAVFTVHHWSDARAGLAELVRVSHRQVVVTWDPLAFGRFWLVDEYLPEVAAYERGLATLETVVSGLADAGARTSVHPVGVPADCTDGFLGAHWRRPHAYLQAPVRAAASGLARLPDDVVAPAMARLADDLSRGVWHERHADLLDRPALDLGYRLVVGSSHPHG